MFRVISIKLLNSVLSQNVSSSNSIFELRMNIYELRLSLVLSLVEIRAKKKYGSVRLRVVSS